MNGIAYILLCYAQLLLRIPCGEPGTTYAFLVLVYGGYVILHSHTNVPVVHILVKGWHVNHVRTVQVVSHRDSHLGQRCRTRQFLMHLAQFYRCGSLLQVAVLHQRKVLPISLIAHGEPVDAGIYVWHNTNACLSHRALAIKGSLHLPVHNLYSVSYHHLLQSHLLAHQLIARNIVTQHHALVIPVACLLYQGVGKHHVLLHHGKAVDERQALQVQPCKQHVDRLAVALVIMFLHRLSQLCHAYAAIKGTARIHHLLRLQGETVAPMREIRVSEIGKITVQGLSCTNIRYRQSRRYVRQTLGACRLHILLSFLHCRLIGADRGVVPVCYGKQLIHILLYGLGVCSNSRHRSQAEGKAT